MKESILKINKFITENPQKGSRSKLYPVIQSVLKVDLDTAKKIATKHCNMLSLYALLYGLDCITLSYAEFFQFLIDNDLAEKDNGWIKAEKEDIFKALNLNIKLTKYSITDDLPDGFYQMKIINEHGTHFMTAYCYENKLYISDTSWRGVGVLASKATKNDKVEWLKRYENS